MIIKADFLSKNETYDNVKHMKTIIEKLPKSKIKLTVEVSQEKMKTK